MVKYGLSGKIIIHSESMFGVRYDCYCLFRKKFSQSLFGCILFGGKGWKWVWVPIKIICGFPRELIEWREMRKF
jgi:hypothetical protein